MNDVTARVQLKASSGAVENLREPGKRWVADFRATPHWVEVGMPSGTILAQLQLNFDGDIMFHRPTHVQIQIAEVGDAYLRKHVHWESFNLGGQAKPDEFFAIPMKYSSRIVRARLLIKGWRDEGHPSFPAMKAVKVMARELKRCRENDIPERLWSDITCTDCVLSTADGRDLKVHRVALMTASPVFMQMLSSDMHEGKTRRIRIPATARVVIELLRFCYGLDRREDLSVDEELSLLEHAHMYELTPVFEDSVDRLINNMKKDNVVPIVKKLRTYYQGGALVDKWGVIENMLSSDCDLLRAFILES